ncbi:MAG: hypothetical protein Kow00124_06340 [Anaerolineae bacterium]
MIRQRLYKAFEALLEPLLVLWLRGQVMRLKARSYDRLAAEMVGLQRALETQQRVQEDLYRQIDERDAQIAKLREEYAALRQRGTEAGAVQSDAVRLEMFRRLQPVMTQLPTLRRAVEEGAALSARDVLDLLAPLDEMMADLGFEPIGQAGAELPFDPTRHHPVGSGARAITPGSPVRVRYVGYMYNGAVLAKAEVTRAGGSAQ